MCAEASVERVFDRVRFGLMARGRSLNFTFTLETLLPTSEENFHRLCFHVLPAACPMPLNGLHSCSPSGDHFLQTSPLNSASLISLPPVTHSYQLTSILTFFSHLKKQKLMFFPFSSSYWPTFLCSFKTKLSEREVYSRCSVNNFSMNEQMKTLLRE